MGEEEFKQRIEEFQNEKIEKVVGIIDVDFICTKTLDSLLYTIPLIERLFLEVLKCIPNSDIEVLTQGKMRPLNSLIKNNDVSGLFDKKVIFYLDKYFNDDGKSEKSLRNKMFYIDDSPEFKILVVFEELYYLIISLLEELRNRTNEFTSYKFEPIKEIV